jgi:hypothetical protein
VIPQKVAVGNPVGNGPVLLACKNPVIYGLPAQRWPLIHLPVQLPSACWCNWQPASTMLSRAVPEKLAERRERQHGSRKHLVTAGRRPTSTVAAEPGGQSSRRPD